MIRAVLNIEKPYTLNNENIGDYLKELKLTKKIIEKHDWTFEKVNLCNSEGVKNVLNELNEEIKLCEHYFQTIKRKDLFKWILQEKHKPNDWNEERDVWTFSNGLVKAVIEIYRREKSTEIVDYLKSDCELYLYFREYRNRNKKILRSEKSIKQYIEEIKESLKKEVLEVKYKRREQEYYNFILNQ